MFFKFQKLIDEKNIGFTIIFLFKLFDELVYFEGNQSEWKLRVIRNGNNFYRIEI